MLVKSATRLNNISRLRSETRWNRSSRLVPLLKSRTAHYISLAVYSLSHFFLPFFFSFFFSRTHNRLRNVEVNAWRTKRDRRDKISETGCYLVLASLMREACVTRFYASGDLRLTMRFLILRDSRHAADPTRTIALCLIELHTADWIDVIVRLIYLQLYTFFTRFFW